MIFKSGSMMGGKGMSSKDGGDSTEREAEYIMRSTAK